MKSVILINSYLALIISLFCQCSSYNSSSNSKSKDNSSIQTNDLNSQKKEFQSYCDKIPVIKLSKAMKEIIFSNKSDDYIGKMNSSKFFDSRLGLPEGKIVSENFVLIIYNAPVSGRLLIIQTYTKGGEKISNQELLGTLGIMPPESPDMIYENSKLKIDSEFNIYCNSKEGYITKLKKDTVISSYNEKYYKIDNKGIITEKVNR